MPAQSVLSFARFVSAAGAAIRPLTTYFMKDSLSVNRADFASGSMSYGGEVDARSASGHGGKSNQVSGWEIADSDADIDATMKKRSRFPAWKRSLDMTCIVLASPIWVPLMLMIMLLIKLVSRGPVFFWQERVGLGGGRFMILKFRSMLVNADTRKHECYCQDLMKADCPMTKLDAVGDSRLIVGGRLLRATGLDELPQLFNVIWGDMSLVGPRPCTPAEFERYEPRQKKRFQCPPGLTGYWQVHGKNKTTFSEMIEMDIKYGGRMSLWMDLGIMLKTFPVLLEQVLESERARILGKPVEVQKQNSQNENSKETIK